MTASPFKKPIIPTIRRIAAIQKYVFFHAAGFGGAFSSGTSTNYTRANPLIRQILRLCRILSGKLEQ